MSSRSRAAKFWEAAGQVQAVAARKPGSAAEKDVEAQSTSVVAGSLPEVTLEEVQEQKGRQISVPRHRGKE